MAVAGAYLPLWDGDNTEQEGFIYGTELDKLLTQATVKLKKQLKLRDVWAHLEALGVLQLMDVERIQHNRARPDQVEELVKHLHTGGTCWQYHALMRAMALTGQGHLIPGEDSAVYHTQTSTSHPGGFIFTPQQLKAISDHCISCKKVLLLSHVFTFEGEPADSGDDIINLADSIIKVQPNVKDAVSRQKHGEMIQIEGSKLLEPFGESSRPVTIRIYADPGDGKTSFARYSVYSWSTEFLRHVLKKDGKRAGCPKWKLMVFLSARDIKTTVQEAVREALGCKKCDEDTLMDLVEDGEWVAVFMDAYDEVRNPETIQKIHDYVKECQKKGGPTLVITCRTNLCTIDGILFDRFVTLSGFTEEQGLLYIQRYTELCEPHLPQPSQALTVYHYVNQHKAKLKALLCNPLKLHIFAALALRGEINLSAGNDFNLTMLFVPLEQYLLEREGVDVSKDQKHAFYRFCLYSLLNDIREFPESLLQEFNVIKAYLVFMVKADRRNNTGKLVAYYSFGHEVVLEFFASRYILGLNEDDRISLLLLICCERQLRNVQRIILELLVQDGEQTHIKLLQTIVRFMLIFQCPAVDITTTQSDQILYDVVHLSDQIITDVPLQHILHPQHGEITINNAADINEKVNNLFDSRADTLRTSCWFVRLEEEDCGTLQHVVGCLEACSPDVRWQLIHETIHLMLPCRKEDVHRGPVWCYSVGGTRWSAVKEDTERDLVTIDVWCPGDAAEAGVQHAASGTSDKELHELYLNTDQYSNLWGQPGADMFTEEAWHRLLQVELPQGWVRDGMGVQLCKTASATGLLSCLTQHATPLSQCGLITVAGGRAGLGDLVTWLSTCRQRGVKVVLRGTHIVLPERLGDQGETNNTPVQPGVVQGTVTWGPDRTKVVLHNTAPVTVLLSCLTQHASHLSQCGEVKVWGGTAQLGEDLLVCVSRCRHSGVKVVLYETNIVLLERLGAQGVANSAEVQAVAAEGRLRWGSDYIGVVLQNTAPVTVVLSCLTHHCAHLSQCNEVKVSQGTAELGEDLVTRVSRCTQAGVKVILQKPCIVVPERLRAQDQKLHQLKEALSGVLDKNPWNHPLWVTETGKKYVWSHKTD